MSCNNNTGDNCCDSILCHLKTICKNLYDILTFLTVTFWDWIQNTFWDWIQNTFWDWIQNTFWPTLNTWYNNIITSLNNVLTSLSNILTSLGIINNSINNSSNNIINAINNLSTCLCNTTPQPVVQIVTGTNGVFTTAGIYNTPSGIYTSIRIRNVGGGNIYINGTATTGYILTPGQQRLYQASPGRTLGAITYEIPPGGAVEIEGIQN